MPIHVPPIPFIGRRRRPSQRAATGPVLLAASYNAGDVVLTLTFDRAIDISGILVDQIVVFDGNLSIEMGGTAGDLSQPTPESMAMVMIENAPYEGEGVRLSVSATNGIVAVEGGGAWLGVTELVLPFP